MIRLSDLRCACGGAAFAIRPGIEPMRDRVTKIALTRGVAPVVRCLACWSAEYPADAKYRGADKPKRSGLSETAGAK